MQSNFNTSKIDEIKKYDKTEEQFVKDDFTGAYELLTPILSLSGYGEIIFKGEGATYKIINIYQMSLTKNQHSTKVYHKVREFTNPNKSISEDKVLNLFVNYPYKNTPVQTLFSKGPELMDNTDTLFVSDEKQFVECFYNPVEPDYLDVTTYKVYSNFVFEYIRKLKDNNLFNLYGDRFKEVIDYYFTIDKSSITFNKIPLIDAFNFANCKDKLNFLKISDENYYSNLMLLNNHIIKLKDYTATVLKSNELEVKQVIDLIVNKCTLEDYRNELLHLFCRTNNKIFFKIYIIFEELFNSTPFEIENSLLEYYLQFKYKPFSSHTNVIYNKKLIENTKWFLCWDLTYLHLIQTEYQPDIFNKLFLKLYNGNTFINRYNDFKGININAYLPISFKKFSDYNSKLVNFINSKNYQVILFDESMKIPNLMDLSSLAMLDKDYFSVFYQFILLKIGLFTVISEPDFNDILQNMLELIYTNKISCVTACKVWEFSFINFYSALLQSGKNKSLEIYKVLANFLQKNTVIDNNLKDFINWIIDHNRNLPIQYIDYNLIDPKYISLIFFYFPSVELLLNLMKTNKITTDKEKEFGLFSMTLQYVWIDGFQILLKNLGGSKNLKNFIINEMINLNDLDISNENFIEFMNYIFTYLKSCTFEKAEMNKIISRNYLLIFIGKAVSNIDEDKENKIILLINSFIDFLDHFNKVIVNSRPLVTDSDKKKFWEMKLNGVDIFNLVAQTGSVKVLQHVLETVKENIKLSFTVKTDKNRNMLFHIKNVEQLNFIVSLKHLTTQLLNSMFYEVDTEGKSVLFIWFTKNKRIVFDLLEVITPKILPLSYTVESSIPGFDKTLTEFLIDNQIDNMNKLIPLLKKIKLVDDRIDLYYVISKNIENKSITDEDLLELRSVLISDELDKLLHTCLLKNYSNTLKTLLNMNQKAVLKVYIEYLKKNIQTINIFNEDIYLLDIDDNKVIEILLPYIYINSFLFDNIVKFLKNIEKSQNSDFKKIKFLPGLLEIPTFVNYTANKDHLQNCFSFAFFIIRNYVNVDEINKIITSNNGCYKPIHVLCGFGRSQIWKNVGGYLNLYYYLYDKTTEMSNYQMPTGYDVIINIDKQQIQVSSFIENDFDMDLITDFVEKTNIPVFDHYLTFPNDAELVENHYAYTYEHKNFFF